MGRVFWRKLSRLRGRGALAVRLETSVMNFTCGDIWHVRSMYVSLWRFFCLLSILAWHHHYTGTNDERGFLPAFWSGVGWGGTTVFLFAFCVERFWRSMNGVQSLREVGDWEYKQNQRKTVAGFEKSWILVTSRRSNWNRAQFLVPWLINGRCWVPVARFWLVAPPHWPVHCDIERRRSFWLTWSCKRPRYTSGSLPLEHNPRSTCARALAVLESWRTPGGRFALAGMQPQKRHRIKPT